jgi:small conductance mechanosensitive channel
MSSAELICRLRLQITLLRYALVDAQFLNSLLLAAAGPALADTNNPASTNAATSGKFLLTREEAFKLATDYGPKALSALLVIIAGLFIARWVGNLLMRGLSKRDMEPPLRMLLVRFAKFLVLLLAIMMAILQLGFEILPLIAGLSVVGVGVGLAMQGVLSNLVAGLTIIFVKKFRVGEYIEINNVQGQVETIELFSTTLIHPDRSRVLVPNRKIVGEIIHNYGMIRQAALSVGVGYDTDLTQATRIIEDILRRNPRVLKDPAPGVGIASLGDSAIQIAIRPWASLADFGAMQSEINKAILEQLREAKISIPFPQREVRLLPGSTMAGVL